MSNTMQAADGRAVTDGQAPVLRPVGAAVTAVGLAQRAAEAQALAEFLRGQDVAAVAITRDES